MKRLSCLASDLKHINSIILLCFRKLPMKKGLPLFSFSPNNNCVFRERTASGLQTRNRTVLLVQGQDLQVSVAVIGTMAKNNLERKEFIWLISYNPP